MENTETLPIIVVLLFYLLGFIAFVGGMAYVITNRRNKKRTENFEEREN